MRSLISMSLFVLILLSSCGGKTKSDSEATNDSSAVKADTLITEEAAEDITDAIIFNVKGQIWRIVERTKENLYESEDVYEFDGEGHLKSIQGLENLKVERDDKGRPIKLTYTILDEIEEPQESSIKYEYNDKNQLIKETQNLYDGDWIVDYTYDDEGRQVSKHIHSSIEDIPVMTFTYPDDGFDSNGNWIVRIQGGEQKATVTRTITYAE